MSAPLPSFYEPLIERDLDGARERIALYRQSESDDRLFDAVTRFAILSYSSSQHGKHALLACLSAHDIRDFLGAHYGDVLTECALYAANSRPPWSEPPITDPPPLEGDPPELLEALVQRDRHAAERWLAAHLDAPSLAAEYFSAAVRCAGDLGHPLIVAVASWRLAVLMHPAGRFATLRVGLWEMIAAQTMLEPFESTDAPPPKQIAHSLIEGMVQSRADVERAHALYHFDAAAQAITIAGDDAILNAVAARATSAETSKNSAVTEPVPPHAFVYNLSRDLGSLLKSKAVATRLEREFPGLGAERIVAAALENLEHGPSFEEWGIA